MESPQNLDPLVPFPQGSTYTPESYDISAAYISAKTPYTEASYQCISALSLRPNLIAAMPARRSILNSPALTAAQGQAMVTFYQAIDALMQKPNAVVIPAGSVLTPARRAALCSPSG